MKRILFFILPHSLQKYAKRHKKEKNNFQTRGNIPTKWFFWDPIGTNFIWKIRFFKVIWWNMGDREGNVWPFLKHFVWRIQWWHFGVNWGQLESIGGQLDSIGVTWGGRKIPKSKKKKIKVKKIGNILKPNEEDTFFYISI